LPTNRQNQQLDDFERITFSLYPRLKKLL